MTAELLKQKCHRSQLPAISHPDTKLTANSAFFSPSREAMSSVHIVRQLLCEENIASWGRWVQCGCGQLGPAVKLLSSSVLSFIFKLSTTEWLVAVSRTNEGAQFCMLASTRGSVSRAVSPRHVAQCHVLCRLDTWRQHFYVLITLLRTAFTADCRRRICGSGRIICELSR